MATLIVERDVPVEMRDGVVLRADVYRPACGGPFPVLLHRIPYDKSSARMAASLMVNPLNAAERDYAVVVQDVRGRFKSDGDWNPFHAEARDGYDTVEWCARQPWCDGKVGIYGSSYMGVTLWQAVVSAPPHLEAAFAYLTGANYHEGWTYTGGAFELGFNLGWSLSLAGDRLGKMPPDEATPAQRRLFEALADPMATYRFLPLDGLPALQGGLAPSYYDWLRHPSYDDYWRSVSIIEKHSQVAVPVLQMTGWYDNFFIAHLQNYTGIREVGATEKARKHQKLIIGPWCHENYMNRSITKVGDVEMGPRAAPNAEALALRWFDYWLKGRDTGIAGEPPVRIFVTGANVWRDEQEWPLSRAREVEYYLHSEGRANSLQGDGSLTTARQGAEAPDTFVYDPADPAPTLGGRILMSAIAGGIFDQRPVEERQDVLVYTSPPLAADLEATGPVRVRLWASSSAPDTDFTAKLVDVGVDGYAANLAEGIIRARYRQSMVHPVLLAAGKTYEYTVDLWAISHVFKVGHCLRLEISSSNFPRFDRNLNTGLGPDGALMERATQVVYHDADHPSCLVVPVV